MRTGARRAAWRALAAAAAAHSLALLSPGRPAARKRALARPSRAQHSNSKPRPSVPLDNSQIAISRLPGASEGRPRDRSWSAALPSGAWASLRGSHQRETRRVNRHGPARPCRCGRLGPRGLLGPSGRPTLLAQPRRRTSLPFQGGLARERTPLALAASPPGPGAVWRSAGRPATLALWQAVDHCRAAEPGPAGRPAGRLIAAERSPLAAPPAMAAAAPSAASAVVPVPRETARTIVSGHEFKCDLWRAATVAQIGRLRQRFRQLQPPHRDLAARLLSPTPRATGTEPRATHARLWCA